MHHILIYDMPHVSRIKLPLKEEKELINALKVCFMRIEKVEKMDKFLDSIFTETERVMLAKRLAIVVMLKENFQESDIANSLHVTRVTVERIKHNLEAHWQGFEFALEALEKEKRLKLLKKVLISLARYSIRAAGGYVKPTVLD